MHFLAHQCEQKDCLIDRSQRRYINSKRLLSVERDQIHGLVNKIGQEFFLSRTFELEVLAGPRLSHLLERGRFVPRKVHRRLGTEEILDVVFVWAPKHAKLKVDVPLVFKGEDVCPGLRKGGYLNMIKKTIEYVFPADLISPYIDIYLSNLDIGEKLHVRNINVHPSLKLLSGEYDWRKYYMYSVEHNYYFCHYL